MKTDRIKRTSIEKFPPGRGGDLVKNRFLWQYFNQKSIQNSRYYCFDYRFWKSVKNCIECYVLPYFDWIDLSFEKVVLQSCILKEVPLINWFIPYFDLEKCFETLTSPSLKLTMSDNIEKSSIMINRSKKVSSKFEVYNFLMFSEF
jgi:hypothetical protein